MLLLIVYIIHSQKSNEKVLNAILGQIGTKKGLNVISPQLLVM